MENKKALYFVVGIIFLISLLSIVWYFSKPEKADKQESSSDVNSEQPSLQGDPEVEKQIKEVEEVLSQENVNGNAVVDTRPVEEQLVEVEEMLKTEQEQNPTPVVVDERSPEEQIAEVEAMLKAEQQ